MENWILKMKYLLFSNAEYFYKQMYEIELERVELLKAGRKRDQEFMVELTQMLKDAKAEAEAESFGSKYIYAKSESGSFFELVEEFKLYNRWKAMHGGWFINVNKEDGSDINGGIPNFKMTEFYETEEEYNQAYGRENYGVV